MQRHTLLAGIRDDNPVAFIQSAINRFRSLPNDEFHPFLQLSTNPETSKLELSAQVNGIDIDNFAFAKVRFRAPTGISADDVKVFFRLFTTAVTHLDYDETTTYRRVGNGANAVALEGMVGGEVASIPFFASDRAANPQAQPDPTNVTSLHGGGAVEVVAYFGCWLDFNHNTTLRNKIRGRHQCLVAEIHYPPSPIPQGSTPANNDRLSQRNLAIVESDNPGGASAHTIVHTFELKPVPAQAIPALFAEPMSSTLAAFSRRQVLPDELFIRWNNLPRDAIATIYLPGIDMQTLLTFTSLRPGMESLAAVDDHTVQCRIGDVTYLTLPSSGLTNLAGLFTIQLPPTVRVGSIYHVSVHQISGSDRTITGSFEIAIPVSRSELLVDDAELELIVLREIESTILPQNRWKPVFARYLGILSDRVRAFGGNPDKHELPGGQGTHNGHDDNQFMITVTGKVVCIHYNCFGDFQGFVIETCNGQQHEFFAKEQRVYALIHEASISRLPIAVKYNSTEPKIPYFLGLGYS